MLDIRWIRQNPEMLRSALRNRNEDERIVDTILEMDEQRRILIGQLDSLKRDRNAVSKIVAKYKAEKNSSEAESSIAEGKKLGEMIRSLEEKTKTLDEDQNRMLSMIPNIPSEKVPIGVDESSNQIIRTNGSPRDFPFEPKPHWELGTELQMLDFERAGKLSGSRFSILLGTLARLERALIQFMLDTHSLQYGYQEISIPHLVKRETMFTSGQLPKFEDEAYKTTPDDLFLIPTAEVFLASMHKDEILEESHLPIRYVAYTPCYRREAGSYGKDVRGLIRVHQFHKVELLQITDSQSSYDRLEDLTGHAESVLQLLGLPYRVVSLSTGDLGFGASLTYDLEVWLPSYQTYREISSCSNDLDFQSRRANIRYRNRQNKLEFVHVLNGSGVAVGRALVAIMENYQNADGSVTIPDALQKYMGGEKSIL